MAQLLVTDSTLPSLTEALGLVEQRLQSWASSSSDYWALLQQVFAAAGTDPAAWGQAATSLQSSLLGNGLGIRLELRDGDQLPGLNGAYRASGTGGADIESHSERIYLNATWLTTASAAQIEAVLLEELGHAIDGRLNGNADSPGDEGERFSALIRGLVPTATTFSENDQKQLVINGHTLTIEAADTTAPVAQASDPAYAAPITNAFGISHTVAGTSPALIDIDGDGDLDLFIGNAYGNTYFFLNTSAQGATAPAFATATINPFNLSYVGSWTSPHFVDVDADEDFDLFVGTFFGDTFFFRNTAEPGSTIPAFSKGIANPFGLTVTPGYYPSSPYLVDIDADGDLDAFIGEAGSIRFFRNTAAPGSSSPAFAAPSTSPFGIDYTGPTYEPSFIDIDSDGDVDAVTTSYSGNGSLILFYRNVAATGSTAPAFAQPIINPFGLLNDGYLYSASFADIDGDGDLDAFIGESYGNTLFFNNTAPALGVGSPTANGTYRLGDVITLTVRFSEAVVVNSAGGSPTLALETGSTDRFATFTGGSGTDTLSFAYTVQPGDVSSDLDLLSTGSLALNGATIRDAAGNNAVVTLAAPCSPASLAAKKDLVIVGAAFITAVNSPTPDGTYGPGAVIQISIAFSEAVLVTGTPLLALETGSTDRFATFTGGSGTDTLTFAYTVQPGDITADLDLLSATAISLNGGSIKDLVFSGDASLLLPTPGRAGSLAASKNLVVDGIAPVAHSTSSSLPGFAAGVVNPFGLSAVMLRNARPELVDIDGDGDLDAFFGNYAGNTTFFRNTASLGSSIPAFALPVINPFGLSGVGKNSSLNAVDSDGDGDLDLFIGDDNGQTRFLQNTAPAGSSSPAFGAASLNAFGIVDVGFYAGPELVDIDGDGDLDAFLGSFSGDTIFLRNTAAAGSSAPAFSAAQTNPFGLINVGINTHPDFVDIDSDGDLDAFIGNNDGITRFYLNTAAVGSSSPAFAPTVENPFGIAPVVNVASPEFADADGDGDLDAFIGDGNGNTIFFRNTAPALGVGSPTTNGTYRPGDVITLTVRFSEAVVVDTSGGTPTLALETGSTDRFATFTGGSGTDTLSFAYTVQPGDVSSDLDLLSTGALALNGATIADATGNNAVLTLAAPGSPASLAAKKDLVIVGTAFITAVNSPTPDGTYGLGAVIQISIAFSEAVLVTGTPLLALETGSTDRFATFTGGSGTSILTFAYTVQDGDNSNDLDLLSRSALSLNGGSIKDLVLSNNASLLLPPAGTAGSLAASKNLVVDALGPQITALAVVADSTGGLSLSSGFSFTANEAGTAELLPATGPALFSTPFLANTPTLITLAAQAAVTSTSLVLTDGLGNRSTAPTQVVLGTNANDAVVALAGDELIGGFQGSDIYRFDTDLQLGLDTLLDPSFGGVDTLDFSSTSTRSIAIDLRGNRPQPQVVNDGLTLGFAPRTKIENVIGGAAGNTITGNLFNNNIQGSSSNDSLFGLNGNDSLSGGGGDDSLDGGNGNDLIIGGTGNDTLTGGAGADRFRFDTPLNAATNRDTITDFSVAQGDRIELDNSVFPAFTTTGTLAATAFVIGATTTADHRVLYNTATGLLSFDSDGNGAAAAIGFATLTPGLALTAANFTVI